MSDLAPHLSIIHKAVSSAIGSPIAASRAGEQAGPVPKIAQLSKSDPSPFRTPQHARKPWDEFVCLGGRCVHAGLVTV